MRRSTATTRDGFTIIEAAVALLIVGMVAVATLSAFATDLRTDDRVRYALEGQALAENRLSAVALAPATTLRALPDSLARGAFASPFADYAWSTRLRERPGDRDLWDVSVTVTSSRSSFVLASRFYRPAPPLRAEARSR